MIPYEHQKESLGRSIFPATKKEAGDRPEAEGNRLEQVSVNWGPRHSVSTVIGKARRGQAFGQERILIPTSARGAVKT